MSSKIQRPPLSRRLAETESERRCICVCVVSWEASCCRVGVPPPVESLCVLAASLDGNGTCVWVHACVCGICKPHLPHLRSAMGIPPERVYACGWLFCVCLEWPPLLHRRGDDRNAKLRSLEMQMLGLNKSTHMQTH